MINDECEDGNNLSGDGCSDTCWVEEGFLCSKEFPSVCQSKCGDGIQASNEECDDSN